MVSKGPRTSSRMKKEDVENVEAKMETGFRYEGFKGRRCAIGSR